MKKKIFILDGSSLLYRAFYALPLLEAEPGVYTNAIVGFTNMLVKLVTDWQPHGVVIAFDKGKHTFRNDMFPEYKGTRKPMPQELRGQVSMLHEMAEAWHIPLLEMAGFEADDIIGTLANKAASEGMEAYIVTGDRDALQLIAPDIKVLFTKKGISELAVYDEQAFQTEYEGLSPVQLIDLKGLMGDNSDNIPGVPKVGPKTAIKLIAAYGSVEQVLLHIEEISGNALKERLRDNQQQAILSKKLATINTAVPMECDWGSYELHIDGQALENFYGKYKIKSMSRHIKKLQAAAMGGENPFSENGAASAAAGTVPAAENIFVLPELQELAALDEGKAFAKAAVKAGSVFVFPLFKGKVPHLELAELAVAVPEKSGLAGLYYIQPSGSSGKAEVMTGLFDMPESTQDNPAWQEVLTIFQDKRIVKYLWGWKNFFHCNIDFAGKVQDLELAAYLLNPAASRYAPENLTDDLTFDMPELPEDAGDKAKLAWNAAAMCAGGRDALQQLAEQGMMSLYEDIELPLVEVLASMEAAGIRADREKLRQQNQQAGEIIAGLEKEIYELAGRTFNIASTKQLGEVLFDALQLPVIKKTKTGYSTDVEVLNELYNLHPIVPKVLEYRQWTKLKSTYLDGLLPLIERDTDHVHTSFNQTVTATGRLSSSDPNLQNIPVRREEGKHIRELFLPGKGYDMLLSADYSQIELRVLADMSQDESFLQAFRLNEDIHARTAAEVFGVDIAQVDGDLRRQAKAVNFGIVYGISDFGLAQDLHIARKEAKEFIAKYFAKCQGVKKFLDETVANAKKQGYVVTKYGRRRRLPGISSSNFNQRSMAERMAMNTPIQGTAADIIKLAMIRTYQALQKAGLKSRILLQVHDELVLEVTEQELPQVKEIVREAMENAAQLSVPLTIDINTGKNWAEAK